jgi:hypothetical protein
MMRRAPTDYNLLCMMRERRCRRREKERYVGQQQHFNSSLSVLSSAAASPFSISSLSSQQVYVYYLK